MTALTSALYYIVIGAVFIYFSIYAYDFFNGEKPEKQIKKIHKHFRKETIKKIDLLEVEPRKYTLYQVTLENSIKKVKLKPGYKVVNIVAKKETKKKQKKGTI
ncbi:hypothetical protein L1999_15560 [Neobacillus drentensis]|uniref:hypothetical protein n=1 Tax=Neobacillus drentensis TaxID=220684 RepID=UPI001F1B363E|nr:hypothetical protein [Neobacillus drentensis]ULT54579.1 hypothetical protein L1999_15560 [Neobacillus drentensis]